MRKYRFEILFMIFIIVVGTTTYLTFGNDSAREVFGIDCEYLVDALQGNCHHTPIDADMELQ